jgi:hypothetical protein
MSTLTRKLLSDEHRQSWGIFDGELRVGSISSGIGTNGKTVWQWSCGFYPGCEPHQQSIGTAPTYDQAKAEFKKAWERLQPQITPEMRDEWLQQQAWIAWMYAMREAGCKLPSQTTTGVSRCFCGVEITAESAPNHVFAVHMGKP